jgi:hypothetical protein
MATAKRSSFGRRRSWPAITLILLMFAGVLAWAYRGPIEGYTTTGAAYGARTACACRYIAGRSLQDCEKDFEPGMALVVLSDDPESRSVTARVPLLASETARHRQGYGCVLEPWSES